LAHFGFPLPILLYNLLGELNGDIIICSALPALDVHSDSPHFAVDLSNQWASTLSLRSIAFMVNSTINDGLDSAPMTELPVSLIITSLVKLFSWLRVAKRRCVCIRLIEVVHDFDELSDPFDWCLQFQKGVVVDLSLNLPFFVLLV